MGRNYRKTMLADRGDIDMERRRHMKIGFVTPWFGMDIQGGAEAELRELVLHLKETDLDFEVLTTCVKSFNSNWSDNYHREGTTIENGITVRRFAVDKRDCVAFDNVNRKLMQNIQITQEEELIFIREMINSSSLYKYMRDNKDSYTLFVFIPYMFGTTYYGVEINPSKAVLIPCFHDESYFYMEIFKGLYSKVAGIIYNAKPEKELTERNYNLQNVEQIVMGIGMDTDIYGDANCFRNKYKIERPFIIYAGRKDVGKNVDMLLKYFSEYHKRHSSELALVLIGGGKIDIPSNISDKVYDLGFVNKQDKYNAYAAATVLCQPSNNESFSLVIMESWLCKRPVLVSNECAVTKNFVIESNGGLYFKNYYEFEGCLNYLLENKETADCMGNNGRNYVMKNFAWNEIVDKYLKFFNTVCTKYPKSETE